MDTITIQNKEYKVQPEVAELLLMVSEERDGLADALRFYSAFSGEGGDIHSGELFEKKTTILIN